MTKDALGHGSDTRGGAFNEPRRSMTIGQDAAHEKMLVSTLKMPAPMLGVMGGPTVEQATAQLRTHYGYSEADIAGILGQGHAKSEPVPVHPQMSGGRQYFGNVKVGRSYQTVGPHTSREAAAADALARNPKAKTVSTGYGFKGSFDMQWHKRGQ